MMLEEAKLKLEAAFRAKTPLLVAEIQRTLVDRPFALEPGATKSSINGIHFEYEWDSLQTVACPLNTVTGYCGRGARLKLTGDPNKSLVPTEIEDTLLRSIQGSDEDAVRDELSSLVTELFLAWFRSGWNLARSVDPSVRGFLSVHDTIWRMDLDSGEEFRTDSGRVKFF